MNTGRDFFCLYFIYIYLCGNFIMKQCELKKYNKETINKLFNHYETQLR